MYPDGTLGKERSHIIVLVCICAENAVLFLALVLHPGRSCRSVSLRVPRRSQGRLRQNSATAAPSLPRLLLALSAAGAPRRKSVWVPGRRRRGLSAFPSSPPRVHPPLPRRTPVRCCCGAQIRGGPPPVLSSMARSGLPRACSAINGRSAAVAALHAATAAVPPCRRGLRVRRRRVVERRRRLGASNPVPLRVDPAPPRPEVPDLRLPSLRRAGGMRWRRRPLVGKPPACHRICCPLAAAAPCAGPVTRASGMRLGLPAAAPAAGARLRPAAEASALGVRRPRPPRRRASARLRPSTAERGRAARPYDAAAPGFARLVETLRRRRRCYIFC